MDQGTPRTDPRILRTRRMLRDAFVELLQEMDIEKISVNRIAERATINRVTFYLHYRDIPDMLEKMADEMAEDIRRILACSLPAKSNTAEETAGAIMEKMLTHIAEHAAFYKVMLGSKQIPIFTDRLKRLLTDIMDARLEKMGSDSFLVKAGIPKDIAMWYFTSSFIGTIIGWLRNDMPYTPHFLAKQFTMLLPYSHVKM